MVGCRLPLVYTYIIDYFDWGKFAAALFELLFRVPLPTRFQNCRVGEQPDIREVGNRLLSLLPRFNNYDENATVSLQEAEAI
jgi:hypothetical protein